MIRTLSLGATFALVLNSAAADSGDKSQYHLFNPTPVSLMREMSTDRPDKTESPYTVDAGHFQIESDLVAYAHDEETIGGHRFQGDAWTFATLNLKAGICNFSDLQVVLFPHTRVRTEDRTAGLVARDSGFGDVLTRLKVNLWGNDGGSSAGAIMPFVKWPTSDARFANNAIEGGVIIPVSFELPAGFSCGVMTQFDWVHEGDPSDYHPEFINSITFSHDIVGKLGGYAEFWSAVSSEPGAPWVGTVDFGFTYALTANMQLDTGVNVGVTRSATDLSPFLGFSVRF